MRYSLTFTLLAATGFLGSPWTWAQQGEQPETVLHVRAELVAELQAISPGNPFRAGLYLVIDRGWHINWKNPGDAGLAPRLTWDLPPGFAAGQIQWPCPELIREPSLVSYGYTDEILLPVEIVPPPDLKAGDTARLSLDAQWLECSDVCIPGRATLHLTLPVADQNPPADLHWAQLAAIIEERMPVPVEMIGGTVTAALTNREVIVRLEKRDLAAPDSVLFFATERGTIDYAAPQEWSVEGDRLTIRLVRPRNSEGNPTSLEGVLYAARGWGGPGMHKALAIQTVLPVSGGPGWAGAAFALALLAVIVAGGMRVRRKRDMGRAEGPKMT